MTMVLHFGGLSDMLLQAANLWVSSTMNFIKDGEFLGMISRAVKSSTNLARGPHVDRRSFTITANRIGPSLVPCGIPPHRTLMVELAFPILVNCDLPWRNDVIHLARQLWMLYSHSFFMSIRWSIRSNPLRKSAKKNLTEQ